ncbi:MAG: hypothetical protein C0599_12185 [Salinivirgaceae bacterium]|nr:MAG: hypothetical protein C0599_12185 [Salinivirgaceae bacterium]
MKRTFLLTSMFVAIVTFSFGQAVTGSPHDLSGDLTDAQMPGSFTGQICAACHIPHNGVNSAGTVLWSQTIPAAGGFTMYSSGTMAAGDLAITSESLKCLGCHDDATSIHGAGTLSAIFPATTADLGTSLVNDHPVGVELVVSADMQAPTNAKTFTSGGSEYVECGSCHNAHDNSL